jgi:hypothetical protein
MFQEKIVECEEEECQRLIQTLSQRIHGPSMHNKDDIYSIETLESTTYKEAVQHQGWKNAMLDKNLIPFKKKRTWELRDLPLGKKPITLNETDY